MSNWLNLFIKKANIDPLDPLYTLNALLEEMSYFNRDPQIYYNHWFRLLPEQSRHDSALLNRARSFCIENFNFDPLEGNNAVITDLPNSLILHLHEFFETMLKKRPELQGPEFETDDDFSNNEGKNEIFREWIEELRPKISLNGQKIYIKNNLNELLEPFKSKIRQYCIKALKFDPYQMEDYTDSDSNEIDIPSAEDLNTQWGS